MQRLLEQNTVPPDGYRAFQPETRMWIRGGDFSDLMRKVRDHRKANNIPLGPLWQAEVEDQLCKMLPPGKCKEQTTQEALSVSTRLDFGDVLRATQVMGSWLAGGAQFVEQPIAEVRADICSRCYMNVDVPGCKPCGLMVKTVSAIIGTRKTRSDPFLRSCAVCHCFAASQVWFKAENLAAGTTQEHLKLYPDFCWKKKAIQELSHV